jgi:transposase
MSTEVIFIVGSSMAGAISFALLNRLSPTKKKKKEVKDSKVRKSYDSTKSELASVLFEKSLLSEAITRVYKAFHQNQIDRLERDRLLLQYKPQLDFLNQRIATLQPITQYADLLELRKSLLSLIEYKINAINERIEEITKELRIVPSEVVSDQNIDQIISESLKIQPPTIEQLSFKKEENSIEQLQTEIIKALEQLEQVELDKD